MSLPVAAVPPTPNPDQVRGVTVEEIVSGTRCSPLTLKEFEDFLIHEEHSVENLQFQVWYRSYCERYDALPSEYKALSPPPAERYTQFSTPAGSIRTASSIKGEDASGWWDKLKRRRASSVSNFPRGNDLEKGNGIGGGAKGGMDGYYEMNEANQKLNPMAQTGKAYKDGLANAEANGSSAAAAADEEDDEGDDISLRSAAAPTTPAFATSTAFPTTSKPLKTTRTFEANPKLPTSTEPTTNSTLQVGGSPDLGGGKAFTRTNTFLSVSDTTSMNTEAMERRTRNFPSLRFANLAPLMSRSSREKELPEGTPLPFIDEVQLIMTTFILPGSTKELNLDARLRKHILRSLQPMMEDGTKGPPATTHPDVFKEAAEHTYNLMERSLPHYLQWAKGNTNTPKMLFWTGVGCVDMGIGVMFALLIMFRAHSRWWRIFSFLFFQFGAMQAYSAQKYFCTQVHGRTARQLYPWELSAEVEGPGGIGQPTTKNTFTTAKIPNTSTTADDATGTNGLPKVKDGMAGLQDSLPFLFEPSSNSANPFAETGTVSGKAQGTGGVPGQSATGRTPPGAAASAADADASKNGGKKLRRGSSGSGGRKGVSVEKASFRSRFWASLKREDGGKVPIFGPERVVEDPYIKYVHNKQVKEILIVGLIATIIFEIVIVAIPEQHRTI